MRSSPLPIVLLWLGGCGTETGNPEGYDVELAYNARSSRPDLVGFEEGAPVVVDSVWLRLDQVSLTGCDGSVESYPGLGLADHAPADAAAQELASGLPTFCGVSTRAVAVQAASTDPVAGASLVVEGHLPTGETFTVRFDEAIDLGVLLDEAVPPAEGRWLLTFDVATWLDATEVETLGKEGRGYDAMASSVRDRLADGVGLYVDLDRDGQVDDDEPQVGP